MKYLAIMTAVALSVSVAHADPVAVETPKAPITAEAAQVYIAKLDKAVKEVCHDEFALLLGYAYLSYQACVKNTRATVAKDEPTGLYAQRGSAGAIVIAAK